MAVDYDHSDILGSSSPVGPGRVSRSRLAFSSSSLLLLGAAALVAVIVVHYARKSYLEWKEQRRTLAIRRRHGIPDEDHRPFTVAYAAVKRAEEDEKNKQPPLSTTFPTASRRDGSQGEGLRHRPGNFDASHYAAPPLGSGSAQNGGLLASTPMYGEDRSRRLEKPSPQLPGAMRGLSSPEIPRHAQHDPSPLKYYAESKTQSSGSPEVPPHDSDHVPDPMDLSDALEPMLEDLVPRSRLSKRMAEAEPSDEESAEPLRHDKRRRKVSNRFAPPPDDEDVGMDVDADALPPLPLPFPRVHGKKRNRTEAGSTMGDDDDTRELEDDGDVHRTRHRRRRLRKSLGEKQRAEREALEKEKRERRRGQKRERERGSDETSEDEDTVMRLGGKTYRRRQDDGPGDDSDVAMSDRGSVVSMVRGRRIGEEWEAHGVKYKIGPDGARLTQALIKADRPLYRMPEDSAHPDRNVIVDCVTEAWLTDEQLRDAKDRQVLAWQSPSKRQSPALVAPRPTRISLPSLSGKELLWVSGSPGNTPKFGSPLGSTASTPLRKSLHLLEPGASAPPSPGADPLAAYRRLALGAGALPLAPELLTPGKRPGNGKAFTKFQKQAIEAEAQERARRKHEEAARAKEDEARKKAAEEEARKKAAAMPPPPAVTFPAKKDDDKTANAPLKTSFAPSTSSPLTAPPKDDKGPSPRPALAFPPAASTPTPVSTPAPHTSTSIPNFFAKPASSSPAPTPAQPNAAPAPTPATGSSTPNFFANVGKPSTPAPVPAPTPGGGMPNFFTNVNKGNAPSPSPAPAPAPAPTPAAPKENRAPTFSFAPSAPTPAAAPAAPKENKAPTFSFAPSAPSAPSPSDASAAKPVASSAPKPTFSFNAPANPATSIPTPASASSGVGKAPFSFSFGGGGAFGGKPEGAEASKTLFSSPAPAPAAGAEEKKDGTQAPRPTFSFGGSTGTFGGGKTGENGTKSAFGGEGMKSAFGGEGTKPVFGSSTFGASPASTPAPAADTNKPAGEKPAPVFGSGANGSVFGQPSKPADGAGAKSAFAFGGSASRGQPVAGDPAKTAFGGAPSPIDAGAGAGASLFGTPTASASQPAGAEAVKPGGFSFNFGKPAGTPSAFGSGGTSAFGFGGGEKKG